MFERFTDYARRIMAHANQQSQFFNHDYIGTEHILLGLLDVPDCVAATILAQRGADLRRIRLETEKLMKSGPEIVTMGKLPQTPRAKRVIEYAIEEARGLNQTSVGSAHLLLGLLREDQGVAAQVLSSLSFSTDILRGEVAKLGAQALEEVRPVATDRVLGRSAQPMAYRFGRFTDRARKVMALANQEAQRSSCAAIDSGHILLGLVKEGSGVGANVLKNLGIDLRKVRLEVEVESPPHPEKPTLGKLPLAPDADAIVERATAEARGLGHNYVGTEHLLLGLISNPNSIAGRVLTRLELSLEKLQREIMNLLGVGEHDTAHRLSIQQHELSSNSMSPEILKWLLVEVIRQLELHRDEFVKAADYDRAAEIRALVLLATNLKKKIDDHLTK